MAKSEDIPSLDRLDEDIRSFREKTARKPRPVPQDAALVLRLGVELMSGALVGGIAGYYGDKWLHTSPVLFIVCFFLGSAGGFLTIMRTLKMTEDKEDMKGNNHSG